MCEGQDLSRDTSVFQYNLSYEVKARHLLEVHQNKEAFNRLFKITDNPFRHQAIYGLVTLESNYKNKYFADLGIVMEERSFSGGNNTVDNLILFPMLKFHSIDTFRIGRKEIVNKNIGGDLWGEDFHDILRFYNFDSQGLQLGFGLDNFWFKILILGDMSYNIGYDLHELYKFSFEYVKPRTLYSLSLSHNQLIDNENGGRHPDPVDFNLTAYARHLKGKTKLESQVELRTNSEGVSMAVGAKASGSYKFGQLVLGLRYYDVGFNRGYSSSKPRYRNSIRNYVGPQLYPLKNYYRPMNQWLLMTENFTGAINLEIGWAYEHRLYNKLFYFVELDLNIVYRFFAFGSYFDNYPLYTAGLKLKFLENYWAIAGLSNKHMNLDVNYQTFYAAKVPTPMIGFQTVVNK